MWPGVGSFDLMAAFHLLPPPWASMPTHAQKRTPSALQNRSCASQTRAGATGPTLLLVSLGQCCCSCQLNGSCADEDAIGLTLAGRVSPAQGLGWDGCAYQQFAPTHQAIHGVKDVACLKPTRKGYLACGVAVGLVCKCCKNGCLLPLLCRSPFNIRN